MNFLKNIFENKKTNQEIIHSKFTKTDDGFWFWNKRWDTPLQPSYKIGFSFNEPNMVDDCNFICKVGKNTESENYKYFGLVFGNDKAVDYTQEEVKNWVTKFPEKFLFDDLNYDGVSNNPNGSPIE